MKQFDHEKLDVYKLAIEFVIIIEDIVKSIPKGRSYLVDQLQRAGTSTAFNIGEGAGEYSPNEKSRFYRVAKRSATESATIVDVCYRLKFIEESIYLRVRELLYRIVSMLIKLVKNR